MTIFICGDSTAAAYNPSETLMTGWGQVLAEFLPGIKIDNRAFAGRSTRTFLEEGRLEAIEPLLAEGDLLLVQFGHNDGGSKPERHTDPWKDYTVNLGRFLDTAERKGAVPVLLTPICVRNWAGGALQPSHGEYAAAVRELAHRRGVLLIDLCQESFDILAGMGEDASRQMHLHLMPGLDARHPDGLNDDVHTSMTGALCYAEVVAKHLRESGLL